MPAYAEREINKRISKELRTERTRDKAMKSGVGAGVEVLKRIERMSPRNPKAQLTNFFKEFNLKAGIGRSRPVSERTRTIYVDNLMHMLDDLKTIRASVQNLSELNGKHALHLIRYWGTQEEAASTVQNKISTLRRFLTIIGKEKEIPKGEKLIAWLAEHKITTRVQRKNIPEISKAWDERNVDFRKVIEVLKKESPITAMHIEMQAAFGLRVKESLQINPQAADCGTYLRVIYGTKGGLPRDVDFDHDPIIREWQRDVLERAKLIASQNRKGILAIQGNTLEQNKKHFYYQCRKAGITMNELGVTAHGLRHQYAGRRYAQITGHAAPVSKYAPSEITSDTRAIDEHARAQISRELGHFRPDITQAYTGSINKLESSRKQRMKEWIEKTEGNAEFTEHMRNANVKNCWLAGRFAAGMEVTPEEKLRLIIQTQSGQPLTPNERFSLKQNLMHLYDRPIDLSEHFEDSPPEDSLELKIRS